jgi:hypothetical protein
MAPDAPLAAGDLLLHSLACYESLTTPVLRALGPRAVCEVGVDRGRFSELLIRFCREHGAQYTGVDPAMDEAFARRHQGEGARFLAKRSLDVLHELPPQDAVFLDGDHNYYTVLRELQALTGHAPHRPLVFLHDVGWPWGRRDQYCAPEAIPAEFRHPSSRHLGAVPGRRELQEGGGFRGDASDYPYEAALAEGGPRNGVLTAAEDFLAAPGGAEWRLLTVPGVFGLGILFAPAHCPAPARERLERLGAAAEMLGDFLRLLESNRVGLFLTFCKGMRDAEALQAEFDKLLANYRALDAHAEALLKAYRELHAAYEARSPSDADAGEGTAARERAPDRDR